MGERIRRVSYDCGLFSVAAQATSAYSSRYLRISAVFPRKMQYPPLVNVGTLPSDGEELLKRNDTAGFLREHRSKP